jgi:hypothetical protein
MDPGHALVHGGRSGKLHARLRNACVGAPGADFAAISFGANGTLWLGYSSAVVAFDGGGAPVNWRNFEQSAVGPAVAAPRVA